MINLSNEEKLDFCDVLILPRHSDIKLKSRLDVGVLNERNQSPIIVANMDTIGTFEFARIMQKYRILTAILKDFTLNDWFGAIEGAPKEIKSKKKISFNNTLNHNLCDPSLLIPTVGIKDLKLSIKNIKVLFENYPQIPMVCLDVANGYLPVSLDAIKQLRDALPNISICAGNVVDSEGVSRLAEAGANIIKVGIGSGGVCLTRKMAGVGYPQFSAILDTAPTAKNLNVKIISDGGITCPGDISKALCAGADYVMIGSYFAGHTETGVKFHGMSSDESRTKRGESLADYRASEGREIILKDKGSIHNTVREVFGGLRSSATYLGTENVFNFKNLNVNVIKVRRQLNKIENINVEN